MILYTILITNIDDWKHHHNRVARLAFLILSHRAIYLSGIHLTKPPILRFTCSSYIHLTDLASCKPTCQKFHKVDNFSQTKQINQGFSTSDWPGPNEDPSPSTMDSEFLLAFWIPEGMSQSLMFRVKTSLNIS